MNDGGLIGEPLKFKVGDVVNVIDRRDGSVVDHKVTIKKIERQHLPALGWRNIATLSCGYAVSTRCLEGIANA